MEFRERLGQQVKMEFPEVPECPECLVKYSYSAHLLLLPTAIIYYYIVIYF